MSCVNKSRYQITNIRTNTRKPGFVYASVVDEKGHLMVNATLEYCVDWIERVLAGVHSPHYSDQPAAPLDLDDAIESGFNQAPPVR